MLNTFLIPLFISYFIMKSRILKIFIKNQDYIKETSDSIISFSLREKQYLHALVREELEETQIYVYMCVYLLPFNAYFIWR